MMRARRDAIVYTLQIAAVCGLLSGYAEGIIRTLDPTRNPFNINLGAYLWWMPAAANLFWFLAVGVGVALVAAWRPAWITPTRLLAGFGWLAILDVLVLWSPPLHRAAAVVLAAGLATVLVRAGQSRPSLRDTAVRRGGLLLAALCALIAVGIEGERAWAEARALRASAGVPAAPNILILLLDTVRARSMSAYGYVRRTTPEIAELAAEGVLFERAYSTSSWSLPSHASMLTGKWAHELETDWRVMLGEDHVTLSEVLEARGYISGGFSGNLIYAHRRTGLAQGFARWEDFQVSLPQILMSSRLGLLGVETWQRFIRPISGPPSQHWHRRSAEDLNERLLRWVDRVEDRPFLAFVNYFDAHVPLYAPADLPPFAAFPRAGSVGTGPVDLSLPFSPTAADELYDRAILGVDREIGMLLDSLEARGKLENTLIVVTSDHGEEYGEHGVFSHGHSLYDPSVHIPLIMVYPGVIPEATRIEDAVSLREVAASVLDFVSVDRALPGCSLARYWRPGAAAVPDTLYFHTRQGIQAPPGSPSNRGDMLALLAWPWKFIRMGDGAEELYNLDTDPWEQVDLIETPAGQSVLPPLRRLAEAPPRRQSVLSR